MFALFAALSLGQWPPENLSALREELVRAYTVRQADVDAGRGAAAYPIIRNQVGNAETVWTACLRLAAENGRASGMTTAAIVGQATSRCQRDRIAMRNWIKLGVRAVGGQQNDAKLDAALARLDEQQRRHMISYLSR